MSLDSWIDERALDMLRALTPSRGPELPAKEPAADFGFDPIPEKVGPLPEAAESARIAPPGEPDVATVRRLRSRLAEIRRRAEMGGVVRSAPAQITRSVPLAPDSPVEPSAKAASECGQPSDESANEPPPLEVSADEAGAPVGEPDVSAPSSPGQSPSIGTAPEVPTPAMELPERFAPGESTPMPGDEAASRPKSPGLVIPEGPLAVRLDAYRRWLENECGLTSPVVFDRHGCPLHPAEGQASFIAAAVSLGVAWREACALTDPPGTLRAVHSAWGTGTMAVIPVPTRFGDLYVAGQIRAAIEPEKAAEIGSALRRTAGV